MFVKERVLASRLILKFEENPNFAKQIGVSTALKHNKKKATKTKKK